MKIRHSKVQINSFLIINNTVYHLANQRSKVCVRSILRIADIFKTENAMNKYIKNHCFLSTLSEMIFYIT